MEPNEPTSTPEIQRAVPIEYARLDVGRQHSQNHSLLVGCLTVFGLMFGGLFVILALFFFAVFVLDGFRFG